MIWQVVEKEDYGTEWHPARYHEAAKNHFTTRDDALAVAKRYVTHLNCENALTQDEQRRNFEAYLMTDEGCFIGIQRGQDWYMLDRKNQPVTSRGYFELEGKTEVQVREVPGS